MGASYGGSSPQSAVRTAEYNYATGKINYNEYKRIARDAGYTPGTAADIKRDYANARGPKQTTKRKKK